MNTVREFLDELVREDIRIYIDDNRLRCNAPKGTLTPFIQQQLQQRKQEILHFLHQTGNSRHDEGIPRAPRTLALPLSFSQQRLWFLEQLEPGNTAYNTRMTLHFSGQLDVPALTQSLHEMIKRHEILRTNFHMHEGAPVQNITPIETLAQKPFTWEAMIDWRHLTGDERDVLLKQLLIEQQALSFDLARGPLLRASLVWLSEQEAMLLLVRHHIISDAWSGQVFLRELTTLYTAFAAGKSSPLPDLPIQYADFAVWQRKELQGVKLKQQLDFWKEQLQGDLPVLDLPTDYPRPPLQSYHGRSQRCQLPEKLSEAITNLGRQEGATLFITLLTAFKLLLHRYSGHSDILVGIPSTNRSRTELEGLIGFFLNTLVIRTDLAHDPTFRALLQRVRKVATQAYAHQDLPFEKLVDELEVRRDRSRHPLFQVMFTMNEDEAEVYQLPGLQVTRDRIESVTETAKFDLTLFVTKTAGGYQATLNYNTDLFADDTIARMLGHFQTLLENIVEAPDQCISAIAMLKPEERHQLLVEWNQTQTDYPRHCTIHELFEAQVERTPDSNAVVFQEQALSYTELNARANQLAHYLQKKGIGPNSLVGIYMERSIEMLVTLLGILKAGGAYLPLDPNYPSERLAYMLAESRVEIVMTQTGLRPTLPTTSEHVLCVDVAWPQDESRENATSQVNLDHLIYVMYTSGSTGRPKGVAMKHRALANLVDWQLQNSITPQAKTLQYTPLSFDVSCQEIFATWCAGGTLVVVGEEIRRDPEALLHLLKSAQIERLFLPFIALQQLAEVTLRQGVPTTLREIITAGEQLQITRAIGHLCRQTAATLHNQYGPTESHVVTAYTLSGPVDTWPALPPIGRPVANTQIYLLDQARQLVPIGIAGELYVGGDGLASGYYARPDLSAERFIANPFGPDRLYKTGDWGRYRADGVLEFIGRMDNQVKVRGFRMELGEIEVLLSQHPAVVEAVVVVYELQSNKQLIAYLVPTEEIGIDPLDLRSYLSARLPDYMIPQSFVLLPALPLTPSGKVDRAALPEPSVKLPKTGSTLQPARDPLELQLIRLWEAVLGKHPIGIQDNFFALGGHSLLAVQLFERIAQLTGKNLPLAMLFQAPTIEQLAAILRQENWAPAWKSIVPVQPGGTNPPLFILPPAASTVLNFAAVIRHLPAYQPVYGLQYVGLEDNESPHQSVEAMATYYVDQICKFQPEGPYLVGGICFGAHVALEIAQELQRQGKSVALLVLLDAGPPANGPTWRYPRRFTLDHFRTMAETWREEGVTTWLYRRLRYRYVRLRNFLKPQKKYFEDTFAVHLNAYTSYQGCPYRGRMLLIQSEEFLRFKYFHKRWAALASSVFEHVVIAGSSHRSVLLQADHTKLAAQKLMDAINQAIEQTP